MKSILLFCCGIIFACGINPVHAQNNSKKNNTFSGTQKIALDSNINNLISATKLQKGLLVYLQYRSTFHFPNSGTLQMEQIIAPGIAIVYIDPSITIRDMEDASITAWGEINPKDKLNKLLLSEKLISEAEELILISIRKNFHKNELMNELQRFKAHLSIQQNWKDQGIWEIKIPGNQIIDLAKSSFTIYIQPVIHPQTLNNQAIGFTNTEIAHQPIALGGYNLKGEQVTIGVGDNGDPSHIDFIDRLKSFNPIPQAEHGNHTTGTVGGNGIIDERYKGFAPKSNLIADYFSQILSHAPTYRHDFGMVITSNSYGMILGDCSYSGTYDLYSQYMDQQAFDVSDLLSVFAAANDGYSTCTPFPLGYATVTGSYSTAKNVLTVANIGKTRDIINQGSSKGPVKDGRLKPEITAVGTYLVSTLNDNTYGPNSGTSMATPNVAGAAGLLYQRFRELNANQNPDNALIKNALMNGADDIDNAGPDFKYGFGLMNIGHSLRILDSNRYFSNQINTNQTQLVTINIPAQTAKAKIMLNWNDPAASPLASQALVNDLDLSVTDPNNQTHLPLTLDPSPGQVMQPAIAGPDHINNAEQITLSNPPPGNYTVRIKGFNIPLTNQKYFVTYDFDPMGIKMQYPFGGERLAAGDSIYIYWEADNQLTNFQLSYSVDNGANWVSLDNNIPATKRAVVWYVPENISSGKCLVRVQRGSETTISKNFTIMRRPVATLIPEASQCPGSIQFYWNSIPGADNYRIFKKQGEDMQEIANTLDTFYTVTGLSQDNIYWVSVAPSINGAIGMRAIAINRLPNSGNCQEVAQHGDLGIVKILSPQSGRMNTSTQLNTTTPFNIVIRNLDNQVAGHYKISYQINNGVWQSQTFTDLINPAANKTLSLSSLDLSAIGSYVIKIAVANLAIPDPVTANDTTEITVRQIANDAIDLLTAFNADFENFPDLEVMGKSIMGIGNSDHWDYETNKPIGRIKDFVNSSVTISGNKSISLDNSVNVGDDDTKSSFNLFSGTFNLSNYQNGNTEIRCSFDYLLHGVPKFDSGNQVWVRGNDLSPWIPLLTYQIDPNNLGLVYSSGSLSLNDILAAYNQSFSSSAQVRFGQKDTGKIGSDYFGNGFTMDNFSIYSVTNDIELIAIDSLAPFNCNLGNAVPLSVRVRNGVNNPVTDISITYQLDNQAPITELIGSINAKDTIIYIFNTPMDLSTQGFHNLSVWVSATNDSYSLNDSILNFEIRNQPIVDSFPYLQNFENSDGSFYTTGNQSSWDYGNINSAKINHAASGQKAWKTNLIGHYNDQEVSFLYSPCFDISQLQKPMLSFSMASDIEEAGTDLYDHAYMEYSIDGTNWVKIESSPESYNLYDNQTEQVWAKPDQTFWQVVTVPLPITQGTIAFRFVLRSDQAANFEGVAIDDIYVYDLQNAIFTGDSLLNQTPITLNIQDQKDFIEQNQIAVSLHNKNETMNGVKVQSYHHDDFINQDSTQYFLPRNFTIKTTSDLTDSITVRFFVPDEAMKRIREDNLCYSCSKPMEVYQLGISKYQDANPYKENNSLMDNDPKGYSFIPKGNFSWVPYDKGYFVEVKVKSFSEFWFNDGGPEVNQPLNINLFNFNAQHLGNRYAQLNWKSLSDENTVNYEVQRANDESMDFQTIATINSMHDNNHTYQYIDTPQLERAKVFYRILYKNENGNTYLSVIRMLDWTKVSGIMNVYPNPVSNGILFVDWFKGNNDPLHWVIFSVTGQKTLSGKIEGNNYNGKYLLDLSKYTLSPGIYALKINSGREHWEFKIVVL